MPNAADAVGQLASIDTRAPDAALRAMLASQAAAVETVRGALGDIGRGAAALADTLRGGGTVLYAAAGSSGLMALADACELSGTFGIDPERVRVAMAGGVPTGGHMPGDTEDATDTAALSGLGRGDLVIVASASGTTPYALAMARAAAAAGCRVIAIANVPESALLTLGHVEIALPTAAEIVEGSTRLGAGTAQKVALNMISTQAGILLGHVHDGLMVNLRPDNAKLRRRAADIVARIAGVSPDRAADALEAAGFDTKLAVLMAFDMDRAEAETRLRTAGGVLRDCLPAPARQTE